MTWTLRILALALLCAATTQGRADERLQFNRDIRPILSDNCFYCHGPDKANRKGDLRLDVRDEALASEAFVPGRPEHSELIQRILSDDPELRMPPAASPKKLTARQQETLRRWIAEGAEYQPHWAFVPPVKVAPPAVPAAFGPLRNPLDGFVRARLAREGLAPAGEASKEALIRRVTLDLTGLPPTLAEVDEFLRDESAEAYEKVVDRLLKSPRYGERMAIDWLDAARYADSNGYQVDRDRELWPWRDWVIQAFNANLPFDQFTIEQLAGDLLPDATLAQRVATGFHRNHMLNEEGGVIADEFLAEYTADRVETTAAVWLGQTFNCARCHDHKFDPFTQRDFYALKAFFHNVPEQGVGNYGAPIRRNAPPFVKLPTPELTARLTMLGEQLKAAEERLAQSTARVDAELNDWVERVARADPVWTPLEIVEVSGGEPPAKVDEGGKSISLDSQPDRPTTLRVKVRLGAGRITALRVTCAAVGEPADVQWSWLKSHSQPPLALSARSAGASIAAAETAKLLDGTRKARVGVTAKGERHAVAAVTGTAETPLELSAPQDVVFELGFERSQGSARWQFHASTLDPSLLAPAALQEVARKDAKSRTPAEGKQLRDFRVAQLPELTRLAGEVAALKNQIAATDGEIPTTLVMEEMKAPRATFVLARGAYDKPGDAVTAATPAVLPPLADDLPRNRLGLARWLVSPQNPLVARVTVNRLWQQFFGTGLVQTSEDFGAQGEPPSHPELLDWLAVTFREEGWDVKRFVRLLVTSDTYRQRSQASGELRRLDPDNRLLARGPRFRLQAEFVRDQALAASGLLLAKVGGPSVKPYHPPGLYEQVTAGNGYNVYVIGKGDELRRRSMYTYWKRSVPPPAMLLFDAPFRETCTLRRSRSNTPLQALNLLNDPTYVEAARFLGQRMVLEGGATPDERLVYGFRLLLARRPNDAELAVLRRSFERTRADFERDLPAAQAWLAVGEGKVAADLNPVELATYATVAATLLNLDECLTKE